MIRRKERTRQNWKERWNEREPRKWRKRTTKKFTVVEGRGKVEGDDKKLQGEENTSSCFDFPCPVFCSSFSVTPSFSFLLLKSRFMSSLLSATSHFFNIYCPYFQTCNIAGLCVSFPPSAYKSTDPEVSGVCLNPSSATCLTLWPWAEPNLRPPVSPSVKWEW